MFFKCFLIPVESLGKWLEKHLLELVPWSDFSHARSLLERCNASNANVSCRWMPITGGIGSRASVTQDAQSANAGSD